jgi:hypothetical protein
MIQHSVYQATGYIFLFYNRKNFQDIYAPLKFFIDKIKYK